MSYVLQLEFQRRDWEGEVGWEAITRGTVELEDLGEASAELEDLEQRLAGRGAFPRGVRWSGEELPVLEYHVAGVRNLLRWRAVEA